MKNAAKRIMPESNRRYLEFMRDIYAASGACGVKTYIWGGLTADIWEGRFLREHGDLDGFTENMMEVLYPLMDEYHSRGYETEFRSGFNMLIIKKNGLHACFSPLDKDGEEAMWRHIGEWGTVYFPGEWLDREPRNFLGVNVYTAGLCFEYAIRKLMPLLNPGWVCEREKDREKRVYLEEKMAESGIDIHRTLERIWSYNPYWMKKGYLPSRQPVLIRPGEADEISGRYMQIG